MKRLNHVYPEDANRMIAPAPRLRLHTKTMSYVRMAQGAVVSGADRTTGNTEALIGQSTGARHAVLTSMGRMALYEGLCALETKGEIILSPLTVPEVISLVILAGYTPIFCDVKPGTWTLDVARASELVTEKTVAILATYFYGDTATATAIRALCDAHGLQMVEDAAQANGAWCGDRHAGTLGDFGILSFSYPKNVTAFYGGCLLTPHDAVAAQVRQALAAYPFTPRSWLYRRVLRCAVLDIATFAPVFYGAWPVLRLGFQRNIAWIQRLAAQELNVSRLQDVPAHYRSRMMPAQALAVADKWREVDEDVQHRMACAQIYNHYLAGIPGLRVAEYRDDRSHGYLYFPVQVADKYALQHYMIDQGCDVAVQHAPNCADLPAYAAWYRDCPTARAAASGTVTLPTYRGFPLQQAERYALAVRRYMSA